MFAPAITAAAAPAGHANSVRGQEWWLAGLQVTQAWQKSEGSAITVAVLGTGVDASYPGLAGSVITGPDYTGSGRRQGSPYWGFEGTAVAGIIAAHQRDPGLVGVAPAAKILSVRVTLEFNDPLASDQALSRRLPDAIADGIRYAADHGARIIDLPLDPGTLGLTGKGDPAAAGGSAAERAAIAYALGKGIVLVAPAGDDGQGPAIVNYPAGYPGVIAVGAVSRDGKLASFSSRRSYVSLTAPGVGLITAAPLGGHGTISSTSTASGIVAGLAALVLSRFPHLTVVQVTQALLESTASTAGGAGLPPLPSRSAAGAGYGIVDAVRAVDLAAVITAASQPRQAAPSVVPQRRPPRHLAAAPAHRPGASDLAGSVLRDAVAAVCALIVLLVAGLLVMRSRRERRGGTAAPGRERRSRGEHAQHGPETGPGGTTADGTRASRRPLAQPGPAARPGWASPGGWQGGGLGELRPAADASSRPAVAPLPRAASGYRTGRGAGRPAGGSGPPWAPAPEPERLIGPLPVASAGLPLPEPGRGIRLPGDMAAPSEAASEPSPPAGFDLTPPADFDLSTPAFGLTPPAFGPTPSTFQSAPPAFEPAGPGTAAGPGTTAWPGTAAGPDTTGPYAEEPPTTPDIGFVAAPVPADHAAPGGGPSYIWDLAATDVFPAASEADGGKDDS